MTSRKETKSGFTTRRGRKDSLRSYRAPGKALTLLERLSDVTYRIRRTERTKPKVVHVNRLWRYHGPGNYTWNNYRHPAADENARDVQDREEVDDDIGLLDLSAEGDNLPASADVPGTPQEADDDEAHQETDAQEAPSRRQRQRRRPQRYDDYYVFD